METVEDIFNREQEFDDKVEKVIDVINTEKNREVRDEKIRHLFAEIKKIYLQAHFEAITDPMTGCFTKKHIRQIFHYQYAAAKRTKQYFSLAVLDIDYLKYVNDTFGHNIGDQMIKRIAAAIEAAVRESDIIFRFGGDEFVLFCSHNEEDGMEKIAGRVEKQVNEIHLLKKFKPSVTIGATTCDPQSTLNKAYKDLFKEADEILYKKKHNRPKPDFLVKR